MIPSAAALETRSGLWDEVLTGIIEDNPNATLSGTEPEIELAVRLMFERVRTALST